MKNSDQATTLTAINQYSRKLGVWAKPKRGIDARNYSGMMSESELD